jgi:membrane-associated phospholipid phosphatase
LQIAAGFIRQIILVPLAGVVIYISLSRVFDGYNRIEDLFMGWSIGILMAITSTTRQQKKKTSRCTKEERETGLVEGSACDSVDWRSRRVDEEIMNGGSDNAEVFQDMF